MAAVASQQRISVVTLLLLLTAICFNGLHTYAAAAPGPKIRAVNLGGWLVIEGWMTPLLFNEIPNNEFLDGRQLQFRSVTTGKYLVAENGGGSTIVANRSSASGWETFKLWRVTENTFQLRVFNGQFWGLGGDGGISAVAYATNPGQSETFEIIRNGNDSNRVRIKAPNGLYLRANSETSVTAEARGMGDWGDGDRSVFIMNFVGPLLRGEFQLTNGYGSESAESVLQDHWRSYIVEDDFRYLRDNGLNAVRIPVGWWITKNPVPRPFVPGSLQALDNAFDWADKYGLGVIIDLHGAPGCQNHDEHSGSRDGTVEWGSDESIQETVRAIDFLSSRYANRGSLLAVELLNEPRAPEVSADALEKYYQAGYNAVRRYTTQAYVIMSSRLGADAGEFLDLAGGLGRTVLDVHYYNLFSSLFDGKSVQWNVDYVYGNRTNQLQSVTRANGPLVFVGEWTGAWNVQGASKADYQRFTAAQLDVFGRATFGWAYWTYKNTDQNRYWNLRWMIDNGYITIPRN